MKKSNASSDHPRKQAKKVFRCAGVRLRKCSRNCMVLAGYPERVSFARDANIRFSTSSRKSSISNSLMSDLPQRQATDALMLTGFWYRALPADRVHRNVLYKATLLEIPLVIGRDRQGHPFALRDACPHRGMPLNTGKFDGENLECPYHGWQFDVHNGQCQLIPSLTLDQTMKVDRIYAGSYPCEEQDGFVWVYIPDPGPAGAGFTKPEEAPEDAPQIEKFSDKYKVAYLQAEMPVSIDH